MLPKPTILVFLEAFLIFVKYFVLEQSRLLWPNESV